MIFTIDGIIQFITEYGEQLKCAKETNDIKNIVKLILEQIELESIKVETSLIQSAIEAQNYEDIEKEEKYKSEFEPSIFKIKEDIKELEQHESEVLQHQMEMENKYLKDSNHEKKLSYIKKELGAIAEEKSSLRCSLACEKKMHDERIQRIQNYRNYVAGGSQYIQDISNMLDAKSLKRFQSKYKEEKKKLFEVKNYFSEKVILCICLENFKDNEDISKLLIEAFSAKITSKLIKIAEQISKYQTEIYGYKNQLKESKSSAPNKEEFHKLQESKQYLLVWYKTLNKVIDFIWYFSLSSTSVLLFLFTEVVTLPLFYGFVLSGAVLYCVNEISTSLIKKLRKEDLSLNTFNHEFNEKYRTNLSEQDEIEQQIKNLQSLVSDCKKSESELKEDLGDLAKEDRCHIASP